MSNPARSEFQRKETPMKSLKTRSTILLALHLLIASAFGQSSAFTYQGKLTDGGSPATGQYDLSFRLFDSASGGTEVGAVIIREDVQTSGGIFNVNLDFGSSPFTTGTGNFLEISVRPSTSTGTFTLLTPRQAITSSPYAVQTLRAESAATADTATNFTGNLGGDVTGTQDSTVVTRLQNRFVAGTAPTSGQVLTWTGTQWAPGSPQTAPAPGSPNYIQNTTTQQVTSNFNISGSGTADSINATTQYSVGGERIIGNPATLSGNLFFGRFTGSDLGGGSSNALFGDHAGRSITTGGSNSFFGQGISGASGTGVSTTTGSFNTFFGHRTGEFNSTGSANSFFGTGSGFSNMSGGENTFIGHDAGRSNQMGSYNTALGSFADSETFVGLTFATSLGAYSRVSTNDTVVIGKTSGIYDGISRPADSVQIPGSLNVLGVMTGDGSALTGLNASNVTSGVLPISFGGTGSSAQNFVDLSNDQTNIGGIKAFSGSIGIGTGGAPSAKLQVIDTSNTGLRVQNNASGGSVASFGGIGKFSIDAPSFPGGRFTVLENGNVGLGNSNPSTRLVVEGSTILGGSTAINGDTNINLGSLTVNGGNLNVAAASGNTNMFLRATGQARGINFEVAGNVDADPTLTITQFDGTTHRHRISILSDGRIQMGFSDPAATSSVFIGGTLGVFSMLGGGTTQVCRGGGATQMLLQCSSSLRYKENVHTFSPGLDLINRLRPVTFDWKVNGQSDMGLVAEEVAEVEPLLVTYYEGKVEGVKYDRVGVIAVNAIKEQQEQIEQQKFEIQELRRTVAALREALCSSTPTTQICKPQEHKK
jgi:hypothetical protein